MNKVTTKVVRKASTDEWVVRVYVDEKPVPERDYFTDDKQDAIDTAKDIEQRQ